MAIPRNAADHVRRLAAWYPVVTVTGPRQSGKTTLCRALFPDKPYRSFEQADVRAFAREDPRGFLDELRAGAILDEAQHVPDLFGYLQVEVDERPAPGRFIITGSQHFGLNAAVSQSLAGRSGMLTLLPLALDESRRFPTHPTGLWETVWAGGYPRIHDVGIPPGQWLSDYIFNYIQRDVRQLLEVRDLEAFTTFLRLAAGRTGQVLNVSALGADAGVSQPTARAWLSVLEASYVCFRLPAWHANVRKRVTRAPKLCFYDTGLACALLGITSADELRHHSLRGPLFESWVTAELVKAQVHAGHAPRLHHYRDARRLEVDLVVEEGERVVLIEVKSGATIASDWTGPLDALSGLVAQALPERTVERRLIYGGDAETRRGSVPHLPWHAAPTALAT